MNIQQHYQTCGDCKCPLFNREEPEKGCSTLRDGNCKYQTIHMLKDTDNQYLDGKKHGKHKRWHENGQLWEECNYVNGEEHGVYREWYENGQLMYEYNWVNGKLHGLYRRWLENGQLIHERR